VFASRDRIFGAAGVVDVAFTDRHGGVSAPPYDSLDLSVSATDRAAEVAANLARVAAAFGVGGFQLMRQVHGTQVVVVGPDDERRSDHAVPPPAAATTPATTPAAATPSPALPQCDAMVTATPGLALCVRVGDCVPVVLADADRGVVGVAHAGRHGVAAGIVPEVVAAMRRLGADRVTGWVGPHVCGGCYEVPEEMRAEVAQRVPTAYAVTTWGTPSLDLGAAVQTQLHDADVVSRDVSRCTRESPDLYSHRRDGAASGRFGGVVVLREASGD
jgi:YfiH family protein